MLAGVAGASVNEYNVKYKTVLSDPDLANLRDSPLFDELSNELKGASTEAQIVKFRTEASVGGVLVVADLWFTAAFRYNASRVLFSPGVKRWEPRAPLFQRSSVGHQPRLATGAGVGCCDGSINVCKLRRCENSKRRAECAVVCSWVCVSESPA